MRAKNITKEKGDQGVGFAIASLLKHGIGVALPISEHLPFDLIAISRDGKMRRLSVKYRKVDRGIIQVPLRSVWSNKTGCHVRSLERGEVDGHAIYCPDTAQCYFMRDDCITTKSITLRIETPKQHADSVDMAKDHMNPLVLFE
jgi:hypothetical protein